MCYWDVVKTYTHRGKFAGGAPLDTSFSIIFPRTGATTAAFPFFSSDAIKANCAPGAATGVSLGDVATACPLLSTQSNSIKFVPRKF